MLRLRYLYAEPLPPAPPPRAIREATVAEAFSRHLERVGNEIHDFRLRRELLSSSSRLAEENARIERGSFDDKQQASSSITDRSSAS
jgi:hypothetical protein